MSDERRPFARSRVEPYVIGRHAFYGVPARPRWRPVYHGRQRAAGVRCEAAAVAAGYSPGAAQAIAHCYVAHTPCG